MLDHSNSGFLQNFPLCSLLWKVSSELLGGRREREERGRGEGGKEDGLWASKQVPQRNEAGTWGQRYLVRGCSGPKAGGRARSLKLVSASLLQISGYQSLKTLRCGSSPPLSQQPNNNLPVQTVWNVEVGWLERWRRDAPLGSRGSGLAHDPADSCRNWVRATEG